MASAPTSRPWSSGCRSSSSSLPDVLILADDLTGAADCAAAFLGRARVVEVALDAGTRACGDVLAVDLDTRSRSEAAARRSVRTALAGRAARRAGLLYKKIDSTLRGHVAAELAAARLALGSRRGVVFTPAFPAQGRRVRDARLEVGGVRAGEDLRALLARAGFPAVLIDLPALRGGRPEAALRAALATGARGLVCDAATDADLDRIARAGLALRPRPLFVGSAGLARALARTLPTRRPDPHPPAAPGPVVTVVGSASAISARQARRLSRSRRALLVQLAWTRTPTQRDIPAVRRFGRAVARQLPDAHYVLTGGETARAVLAARGIRAIRLLGEVEPGVPFGLARGGTLVCTKAGGFGGPDTLLRCAARLEREVRRRT